MLLTTVPLFGRAFQLRIVRRFWSLSSLLLLSLTITSGANDSPPSRKRQSGTQSSARGSLFLRPGGPARPGGAPKGFTSSTSVSSDSQDSVSVFNESLSLGTVFSLRDISSSSCAPSSSMLQPCFSPAIPFPPLRHAVNCVLNCVNFHACRVQKAERISTQKNQAGTDQKNGYCNML